MLILVGTTYILDSPRFALWRWLFYYCVAPITKAPCNWKCVWKYFPQANPQIAAICNFNLSLYCRDQAWKAVWKVSMLFFFSSPCSSGSPLNHWNPFVAAVNQSPPQLPSSANKQAPLFQRHLSSRRSVWYREAEISGENRRHVALKRSQKSAK